MGYEISLSEPKPFFASGCPTSKARSDKFRPAAKEFPAVIYTAPAAHLLPYVLPSRTAAKAGMNLNDQ
jgi:hypothetical protein